MKVTEAETRKVIDDQLRKVGWEADTKNLCYSKGIRPEKGRNIAIAEWKTNSEVGENGYVDYALFVGEKFVGLIEAKASYKNVSAVLDYQCKDYAKNILEEDKKYLVGTWNNFRVPFIFATNGRGYVKEIETMSGIWFQDLRKLENAPKALRGWISPEGILELLEKNSSTGNDNLQKMSFNLLCDKDGLNLRDYQLKAVQAVEEAVLAGQKKILLAMATGTGKTRTVLGMIYRFLKSGRFRRILFLVDRNSLGEQAQDVFKEVKLEDLMTLENIYNIAKLGEKTFEKATRLQVATVQSMVKRLLYAEENLIPSVTDYDLIIVDEAHRGYILDKEISADEEDLFANQQDYQSKYRSVIEYFDAVKIGLTATPALHTTQIFGKPVFKYGYREAVMDGWLSDYDLPHILRTKLSTEGIQYKKGDDITIYNTATGEIENLELVEDELKFEVENFNKQVVNENFNRVVLEEICKYIEPDALGKTLIYAVDETHADLIVKILKEIYSEKGANTEAVTKITGSVGDKRRVQDAIKRFKNERYPNVVVTVDLLTTGIDVPQIDKLVFLRRVKSRILFEQMLGRATRLCPEIGKTHFEIYDAVGVYEALEKVSEMKPIVANPMETFSSLLEKLKTADTEKNIRQQIKQLIGKLQRIKNVLDSSALEQFKNLAQGKTPSQFIAEVKKLSATDAKKFLLGHTELFQMLQNFHRGRKIVISSHADELTEHTRGYGSGQKPQDYLEEFTKYLQENKNEVAALNIICTRPKDLTREDLKKLYLTLESKNFTVSQLNSAISQVTNVEITADIISLIRRYAIGSQLFNHEDKIKNAVQKLKSVHNFTAQELKWINRIEKYLLNESLINVAIFDEVGTAFKNAGGFKIINKAFGGNLANIIDELNNYLYDDGGKAA